MSTKGALGEFFKHATRIADLDQPSSSSSPSFEIASPAPKASNGAKVSQMMLKLTDILVSDRIRQQLDPSKTESLAHSIRTHGFRGVLWVRQVKNRYHLIAGGRRYAACQLAGIDEVPVEIWQLTDAEALQLELLENFQREDLNPIEETEGILRMLEATLDLERSEVVALFNWNKRHLSVEKNGHGENVFPAFKNQTNQQAQQWEIVEDVFKLIGKFSPESFRTSRLPLLNLPEEIIEAVRSGELEYTKARLIGRIKNDSARDKILSQSITDDLSYADLAKLVKQVQIETEDPKPQNERQVFRIRTQNLFKRLNSASLDSKKSKKLEKLLAQIESLLDEDIV
jgi:ParB family chromosome partitioning protein